MIRKALTYGGIAFAIFFIAYRPQDAASIMKSIGSGAVNVATGFGNFFSALVA